MKPYDRDIIAGQMADARERHEMEQRRLDLYTADCPTGLYERRDFSRNAAARRPAGNAR